MDSPEPEESGAAAPTGTITMADLARLAGVSVITVSRALRGGGSVSPRTRERVRALAEAHGYQMNFAARNLRLRRSHVVCVVVEMEPSPERPMSDPYPLALLGGIVQELAQAGYSVMLSTLQTLDPQALAQADAVILLGQGPRDAAARALGASQKPRVVWGARQAGQDYVVVGSDNRHGGSIAAERLLHLGRRRLVFLGDTDHAEVAERKAGFTETLEVGGASVVASPRSGFTFADGLAATRSVLDRGLAFDGVFAASDLLAMGAVRALLDHGLRVPQDVSVIGYDDTPLAASFVPALTSVRQDWREGGALLARRAIDLISGQPAPSEILPASLAVRET